MKALILEDYPGFLGSCYTNNSTTVSHSPEKNSSVLYSLYKPSPEFKMDYSSVLIPIKESTEETYKLTNQTNNYFNIEEELFSFLVVNDGKIDLNFEPIEEYETEVEFIIDECDDNFYFDPERF